MGAATVAVVMAVLPEWPEAPRGYGGPAGSVIGLAIRGYWTHRTEGTLRALGWSVAFATGGIAAVVAILISADILRPAVSTNGLIAASWPLLIVGSLLLSAIAAILWERSAPRRRGVALSYLAVGILIMGLVGLISGGSIAGIGVLAVAGGIGLLLTAQRRDRPAST